MRHYKKGRKLGTDASHTKAMKKSLVGALLANDRIKTTETRAKEIRGDVDRVITWAKKGDIHSRRLAIAAVGDKEIVREVFEKVAQGMFQDRPGGYTRIMKLGPRQGDKAPMVIMELVTEPVKKAGAAPAPKKESRASRRAAKAEAKAEKAAAAAAAVEAAEDEDEDVIEAAQDVAEAVAAEAVEAVAEAAEDAVEVVEKTVEAVEAAPAE